MHTLKLKNLAVAAFGLLSLLAITNCSSKFSKFCETQRNCLGGNDADEDACIEASRAQEDVADAYDCGDAFGNLADCTENVTCKDGKVDSSGCKAQADALNACEKAASGKPK